LTHIRLTESFKNSTGTYFYQEKQPKVLFVIVLRYSHMFYKLFQ